MKTYIIIVLAILFIRAFVDFYHALKQNELSSILATEIWIIGLIFFANYITKLI